MNEKRGYYFGKASEKVVRLGESEQVIYSDFDIDIYKGDFTVIMGASGAAKLCRFYYSISARMFQ